MTGPGEPRAAHRPAVRRRGARRGRPDGTRIAFTAPVDIAPAGSPGDGRSRDPQRRRCVDRPARLQGRRRRTAAHAAPARARAATWPTAAAARSPTATSRSARWPGIPTAGGSRSPPTTCRTPTAPVPPRCSSSTSTSPQQATARVGPAGGQAGPVELAGRRPRPAGRRAARHRGRARRPAAARRGDRGRRLVADLSARAGPQRDAGRARLPRRRTRSSNRTVRTLLFCARDAGCTHLYRVAAGRQLRARARVLGAPDEVGQRAVGGRRRAGRGLRGRRTATATARSSCWTPRPASATVLTDHTHGVAARTSALFAAEPRTFTVGDGIDRARLAVARPGTRPSPGRCCWTPTAARTTPGARCRTSGHGYQQLLVAQGWSVLMLNVRASDGYGEEHFTRNVGQLGSRRPGRLPRPGRRAGRRGHRRPRPAGRHRVLLRRLHHLLADRAHRPVRRRGRRRRGRRHGQPELASDAGHPLLGATLCGQRLGLGRGAAGPVADGVGRPGRTPDPGAARRRRRPLPDRPRPSSGSPRCAPRACPPAGALPRRVAPVHPRGPPVAPSRLLGPPRRLARRHAGGKD